MTPTESTAGELGDFTTTARSIAISGIAVVLGAVSTALAFVLLRLIAFFTNLFFFQQVSFQAQSPAHNHLGVAVVAVPVIGGLVVGVIARFGSEKIRGHGIPEAIESILLRGSRIEPRVAFFKPLSAAISIGSGGPFGAEGPIIMTGGAFGSMLAQLFHLTSAERKTLLVAGAAAGMSATFSAPLAATLLAVELLLFEWKPRSFVPVALASATAAALRPVLLGEGPLFPTPPHGFVTSAPVLLASVVVGLSAGGLSVVLTRAVYAAEDRFLRLRLHWMWWPAIGGIAIGLGGLIAPRALGVGYDVIEDLLSGRLVGKALLVLAIVKATIWATSLGSGTSGGVLAPLLIMGAAMGALLAPILPDHGRGFWALVGMGAILGGTMRSPFTGIVFSFELTHDTGALLPLLVAVSMAHGFTVLVLRRSILTEKIARRGFHLSREYAIDPLEILFVREVMLSEIPALPGIISREDLAESIAGRTPRQHLFVVTGAAGDMMGVVTRRDLERWAQARGSLVTLGEVARQPVTAHPDEPLRAVAQRMARTGRTELPVVARHAPTELIGWITLAQLLKARTRHAEEEERRDRPLRLRMVVPRWMRTREPPAGSTS